MSYIQHPYLKGSLGQVPDPRQRYRIESGWLYKERLTPLGFKETSSVELAAVTSARPGG